jgi:myo-inositol 2-dehydrogenase/D-chiro-inositol 1-dehydrogenase
MGKLGITDIGDVDQDDEWVIPRKKGEKMDSKIMVGILGAGRIGKLHAANIVGMPEAQIKTIADPLANEEMVRWAAGIGVKNITKNPEEVLDDPEIKAVIICSSTNTHADFIIKAAAAGKNIFCEKPIDLNIQKIQKALAAVEKARVKLQVGFVRRFDHNHRKVHDLVRAGKVGAPHIVKISSRDPQRPPMEYVKVSGGIFADMMIHDFDMARYLCGSEVQEVYAAGSVLIDPKFAEYGDVDTAMVILKFQNGALGFIDNSRETLYGYDQRTEVLGSKGCVTVANDTSNTAVLTTADGVVSDKPLWFFLERYNDAFVAEMRAFFDAIIKDTEPPVTGIDGLRPVQIAMAAGKSLKEGRSVKISEIES